jgi:small subunit ribosomal protein S3
MPALLRSDVLLRAFLKKELKSFHVSAVEIERSEKMCRVIIDTSRHGMIIGRNGEGAEKLKAQIATFARKKKISIGEEFRMDIREVRSPEANAVIVGKMIAEGLEKRMPFRRVLKQMIDKVMANRDVQGVKIYLGGRLGGADMARSEVLKKGRIPLQTFRANIDYAQESANHSGLFCARVQQPKDQRRQLLGQIGQGFHSRGQRGHFGAGGHLPVVCG